MRRTPGTILSDGRAVLVEPLLFGGGRMHVGPAMDIGIGSDEQYDYESYDGAITAMKCWNDLKDDEPKGWHRHRPSNRRRKNGDPKQEYIAK